MDHKDLVFHKKVPGGRKDHYIFTQGNIFYVLTEQDNGIRGNFLAISKSEVENVKKQISENRIPGNFNCNDIYKDIKLSIAVDKENPSYYVDRLTRVCYILYTQKFLDFHMESGKLIFKKVYGSFFPERKVQSRAGLTQSGPAITKCPHCKVTVSEGNLEDHIKRKCPVMRKRKKTRKSVRIM